MRQIAAGRLNSKEEKMEPNHRLAKGFTLIELIFVIAIIVVLASIFVPLALDKLAQANQARADSDLNTIAASLASFFTDVKHMPACDNADCNPITGNNNDLKMLAIKADTSAVATTDIPAMASGVSCTGAATWDAAGNLSATPGRNNAFNQLVVNNPNADATEAESGGDYSGWKGPYIAKVGNDPWGNRYIIHVGAMEKNGVKINTGGRGWILSAGEDGVFNTCPEASSLSGDDRGFIFVTQ